jgi:1-acyl-sn-glycerol-3-phosphate acyltransferase
MANDRFDAPPDSVAPRIIPPARPSQVRLPLDEPGGHDGTLPDTADDVLESAYYTKRWGRLAMRQRHEDVDEFGKDPVHEERYRPLLDFLYDRYFRVSAEGLANIPAQGRAVIVANHSGTVPIDGLMLKAAVERQAEGARELRWLTEDFVTYLPFLGAFMNRMGAVRACQENAERLLSREKLVAVFPEGVKGMSKLFRDRYRLQRFGRGGFVRLCLRTRTPIIPCAIVGAEETNPILFRFETIAKSVGLPYIPVTPTFPLLGPAGLMPAPTKWTIRFGEPIDLAAYGPEAADDQILVGQLAEQVRTTIQDMVDLGISQRESVFFG